MRVQPLPVLALVGGLMGADHVRADLVDADQVRADQEITVEVVTRRALMSAPVTPAVGSGFVSGGDLFDAGGVNRVGEGFSHCGVLVVTTGLPPSVTAHCTSTFRLPDGELHLSGLRDYRSIAGGFENAPVAVVGGTGAYANARGEGEAVRSDSADVGYRFTFTITTG
ncbi:allene oxide cyclase barrel-like domain-containing protein [Saccharothrix xinjiangensis]|uniref:Allene oxide cyclase barrel-like domain-containing protein n=1 Tax=Saccharothrix xinjiangensis TaxID=204798 RepID=A0ABV9Y5Q8_9PSEU